jgi:hypothetical protein
MLTNYNELPQLVKKIRAHLVILYDSVKFETASGVLIEINNHIFILTAEHVLTGFENLVINFGLPFQKTTPKIINKWISRKLDIAFIELKYFDFEILKFENSAPFKIAGRNKTVIYTGKRNIGLCGYPTEKNYNDGNKTAFIPVFFGCTILNPELWPSHLMDFGKNKDQNIVIPYGPKYKGAFFDKENRLLEKIEPAGLSGCGIWYYSTDSETSDNPKYSLLAIQSSYFRDAQVLVGTLVTPLIQEISDRYNFELKEWG